MIPQCFLYLPALPTTAAGKIDRLALLQMDGEAAGLDTVFVPPATPLEKTVAQIWEEVLGVPSIGIHDNFFDLGGDSLIAIQLIARLRTRLKGELSVRQIFDSPTIVGLAAELARDSALISEESDFPLVPVPRKQPLPLSFSQERFWLLDQLNPNDTMYHSNLAFRLHGKLNTTALTQSFQEIVNRHEILRTVFPSPEGSPVQVIQPHLEIEVPIYDLQSIPSEDREIRVRKEIQEELQHPFNLAQGPLFRAILWKIETQEHVLFLDSAHMISDGWSKVVMLRELSLLYHAHCENKASPLSPNFLQYADFAVWQRELVQDESGERHLAYWKEHLKKPLPVLQLPTDFPRQAIQTHSGSRVTKLVPYALSQQIRKLCQQEHCTTFMLFLSTLSLLLFRYTGDEDVVIGAPTAGRNRQEWEGLIGCFLNTLPLRIDLSGNPTFRELLGRVRQVTLDSQAHEEMPFEKIIDALELDCDLSSSPLFQVFLNMHEFSDDELPLNDLEVSPFPLPRNRAIFDLTLYFKETEDGIKLSLNYNADLFAQGTMTAMMQQFVTLVTAL